LCVQVMLIDLFFRQRIEYEMPILYKLISWLIALIAIAGLLLLNRGVW